MPKTATFGNAWDETDSFFDEADASRLTLTPPSTLRRWIAGNIVTPSRIATDDEGREVKGFSLRDLAYIRIIRHLTFPLRGGRGIPLEAAVEHVSHALNRLSKVGTHWVDARLLPTPGPLVFLPDEHGVTQSLPGGTGQRVFDELLDVQVRQMLLGPESLLIPEELLQFIEMNPRKRDGHPVIRGTNIGTMTIFSLIEQPDGEARAAQLFPFLKAEAFLAVRKFHREYLHERTEIPVG